MSNSVTFEAWDLVGMDGLLPYADQYADLGLEDQTIGQVRVVGGRALYDGVSYDCNGTARNVKLFRIEADRYGLRVVERYVAPETRVEFVPVAA